MWSRFWLVEFRIDEQSVWAAIDLTSQFTLNMLRHYYTAITYRNRYVIEFKNTSLWRHTLSTIDSSSWICLMSSSLLSWRISTSFNLFRSFPFSLLTSFTFRTLPINPPEHFLGPVRPEFMFWSPEIPISKKKWNNPFWFSKFFLFNTNRLNELIFLLSQNRYFYFKLRDRFYLLLVYSILIGQSKDHSVLWLVHQSG